jgi:hypothetical protein
MVERLGPKALLGTFYAVQHSPAEPAVEIASFMGYSWGLRSNMDGGCGRESQGECSSYNAILCAIPRVTKDMVRGLFFQSTTMHIEQRAICSRNVSGARIVVASAILRY